LFLCPAATLTGLTNGYLLHERDITRFGIYGQVFYART
jgi:hypothetical protein